MNNSLTQILTLLFLPFHETVHVIMNQAARIKLTKEDAPLSLVTTNPSEQLRLPPSGPPRPIHHHLRHNRHQ